VEARDAVELEWPVQMTLTDIRSSCHLLPYGASNPYVEALACFSDLQHCLVVIGELPSIVRMQQLGQDWGQRCRRLTVNGGTTEWRSIFNQLLGKSRW
jgi:hypothetical protein